MLGGFYFLPYNFCFLIISAGCDSTGLIWALRSRDRKINILRAFFAITWVWDKCGLHKTLAQHENLPNTYRVPIVIPPQSHSRRKSLRLYPTAMGLGDFEVFWAGSTMKHVIFIFRFVLYDVCIHTMCTFGALRGQYVNSSLKLLRIGESHHV